MEIRFVLHRPKRSENIGAAARALANTGAGSLWLVDPQNYDVATAAKVATHGARHLLDRMPIVKTLDEALADCVDVVMTSGREIRDALDPPQTAARLVPQEGPVALVFGDEQNGLVNAHLRRAWATATIPTAEKSSLNLAQAVLVFAWEVHKAAGATPLPVKPPTPLANDRLLGILRGRARDMLLEAGFLNPQQPDHVLDELVFVLRRAHATQREVEMLLSLMQQLDRLRKGLPVG